MAKNLDLNNKDIVSRLLADLDGSEDRERKKHAFNSWQIYSGNQKPYVQREIKRMRPSSWEMYTISDISIAKMVTDKLSKSYKEQPIRTVGKGVKNDRLQEIYKEAKALQQLPYGDKMFNLNKYFLMWVNYLENDNRYNFTALRPDEFSIVIDQDTGDLIGVILNYGNTTITNEANTGDGVSNLIAESQADSSAEQQVFAMWSMDNFVMVKVTEDRFLKSGKEVIKKNIDYITVPGNPNNVNKLGVIPFVFMSKEPTIDYPTTNPLSEQSVTYNAINSEGLTASTLNSGQMVIKYPEKYEGKFKTMTTGLSSAIKVPQSSDPDDKSTDVEYINANSDLEGQKGYYLTYLKQILAEHGITTAQGVNGDAQSFSSALEKMISEAPVQHIIEENQERFVDMEQQMFEIIKAWETFLGKTIFKDEDELDIKFKKPTLMTSDSEVLANIKLQLELGLIEEFEKYQVIDPNLSDDKAKEKLERVNQGKLNKVKGFMNANQQRTSEQGSEPGPEQSASEPTDISQE